MNQETRVGIFLLIAIAAISASTLFLTDSHLFKSHDNYFVDFKDVEALPPKAAVKISGVEIGKVKRVELRDGLARVTIGIDPEITLYADAVGRIGSTGIIGTRFVELVPGSPGEDVLPPESVIKGAEGTSLNEMVSKISRFFERSDKYGDPMENLSATISNIRRISESLNTALGDHPQELESIVMNIRDITESAKDFVGDLQEISNERKEDVKVALKKIRDISEKLDGILTKIQGGTGMLGAFVSDEKAGEDVKAAVADIRESASSAKKVLGRFTMINTYWNYRFRYDHRDDESKSDIGITFVPRPGKFYALGVTNVGDPITNEKHLVYERKNRITAVVGQEFGPFTAFAGAIRSDGGVGLNFRPLWKLPNWNRRLEITTEASDFSRDRVVRGNRLDRAYVAAGLHYALTRWLWVGVRQEDILEHSSFMTYANINLRDEDLAYLLGFASFAR